MKIRFYPIFTILSIGLLMSFELSSCSKPAGKPAADADIDYYTCKTPGMVMNSGSDVTKTGTPGVYRVKLRPQKAGDWMIKLSWQGPAGQGQAETPVSVRQ
jgi:hypothetical protein